MNVSADNRFVLYVNGQRAGNGPARSDLAHWHYETFDVGPLLKPGENVFAAVVWNFGGRSALAQISDRTAFLLGGASEAENAVNTGTEWDVAIRKSDTHSCPNLRNWVATIMPLSLAFALTAQNMPGDGMPGADATARMEKSRRNRRRRSPRRIVCKKTTGN